MELNEEVKNERRKVLIVGAVVTVLGVIALLVVTAFYGVAWYWGVIASVVYIFGMLIVEANAEDRVLVKAYGPSKKEAWTGRAGEE